MKLELLQEIIKKKSSKKRFAVLKNLSKGKSELFELENQLSDEFRFHEKEIKNYYNLKKNGVIDGTKIFIQNYTKPIEVIIVGAVHIAQYLVDFSKNLNLMITIIDPREFFTKKQKFENVKIINEWPEKILKQIQFDNNSALITLTHDPKIDDPAIEFSINNKINYIGCLGSKNTHKKRLNRFEAKGFSNTQLKKLYAPIGIDINALNPNEIALSIASQITSHFNEKN